MQPNEDEPLFRQGISVICKLRFDIDECFGSSIARVGPKFGCRKRYSSRKMGDQWHIQGLKDDLNYKNVTLSKENDRMTIFEGEFVNLRLDVDSGDIGSSL